MRKGSSIIGLKILTRDEAADLGKVQDLIFDHNSDEVLALVVSGADLVRPERRPRDSVESDHQHRPRHRDGARPRFGNRGARRRARRSHYGSRTQDVGHVRFTPMTAKIWALSPICMSMKSAVAYSVMNCPAAFSSDTLSGKRFMVPPSEITVGKNAMIVPGEVADDLEAQRQNQPGGLKATVGGAYDSTKTALVGAVDTAKDKYSDIASASVDKQKEFVVGKTAGKDVLLPTDASVSTPETSYATSRETPVRSDGAIAIAPTDVDVPAGRVELPSTHSDAPQQVLVHQGETITQDHADRAEQAGILHQLLIAAGAHAASGAMGSASESAQGTGGSMKDSAAQAAIGKTAGKDVTEDSGSLIAADGMTITQEMMDHAHRVGKEKELIAAAGLGVAKDAADTVKEHAGNLWDSIKGKAAELSDSAHEKRAEMDAAAQQKKINDALGRPVTRVILNQSDKVLLNTGDLITHAAINDARQAGVLDVLLDSVFEGDPEITPEMLRATEPGEDALDTQAQPSGGPITATVPQNDNHAFGAGHQSKPVNGDAMSDEQTPAEAAADQPMTTGQSAQDAAEGPENPGNEVEPPEGPSSEQSASG